jgi:hypothetical protein
LPYAFWSINLVRGLARRSQQAPRIPLRMAPAKNGASSHQQVRTGLDDGGDRVVSHPPVHFDSKCQPHLMAQLGQPSDLFQ